MGYESLHIMELPSVQYLQADDVIPIYCHLQCTVVLVGVVLLVSLLFDGCIKSIQVVVFSKVTI